ncbi:MAG: hypothetical protein COS82_04515 [Zetaproteobacteria bacterium CG06_land_8_20_14_3_00_59_53]|nr:MAG: hypothetical protein COX56_10620 [Zetaproteobacteria bacterium CG23_combo_of_CG06-09_8_20_14_all_59_86]PIQ65195.1 MAG: hypothetical protein COV97_05200 [Zetaproteobacteria bacterium CG11_big_fil_rev_8_21_14_0_20_59_439]PIU70774.1 MAG: hypothetical protein COS82_04515 [Zetaproteobacteria bacterium CG06_land_8_20_14_3_00_59_53]PIU96444.1 MAG: hypothetical protein COS62_08850 [Zetaproteobacteria bacterium CG03_land_8_20_14_0_80_59_51]PIY45317.1 MAG: hypothetical protein COZ02_09700 [Zetapr
MDTHEAVWVQGLFGLVEGEFALIKIPECATSEQRKIIKSLIQITGNPPNLEQSWAILDFVWDSLGCNNHKLDWERIGAFYNHPVWLLIGLFIEQHEESMQNREAFVDAIAKHAPRRLADFGGGYGGLARMVASRCPDTQVDVIEPHPTTVALELSKSIPNLTYRSDFDGEYDAMIAVDVFEHLPDPLVEVERTSSHLKQGGVYYMANCFFPVIKCHLPSVFHFRYSFPAILGQMGLKQTDSVKYAQVYEKTKDVRVTGLTRLYEKLSVKSYPFLRRMNVQPR